MRSLLAALFFSATLAVAQTSVLTPLKIAVIHKATAPSVTPGACVFGASPDVLADDTGVIYTCIDSGASDYYEAIPGGSAYTGGAGIAVTGTVISTASGTGDFISNATTLCTEALEGAVFLNGPATDNAPYFCTIAPGPESDSWYVARGNSLGYANRSLSQAVSAAGGTSGSVALLNDTLSFTGLKYDPGILYNATTNVLTAGGFVGNLNPSAATTDTTSYIAMFDSPATTAGVIKTDTGLMWNATTDELTATSFVGAGGGLTLTASGFDGNLTTSDDTLQEVAQKVDDLTGGRSLTMGSNNVDADVELYTRIENIIIDTPATADSGLVQMLFPTAVTLTRVSCSTDAGTVDIQFDERVAATPNTAGSDIFASALQCTTTEGATTTFGGAGGAGVASRVPLNLDIDAVVTATRLRIAVEYTVND